MDIPSFVLVHTVQVETWLGSGSFGETYAPAQSVPVMWQGGRRVVAGANGEVLTGKATAYAKPGWSSTFTPQSRVTAPDGRTYVVVEAYEHDDGGMGAPQHTEVVCE